MKKWIEKYYSEEVSYFLKIIAVYGCWKLFHAYMCRTPESQAAYLLYLEPYEKMYASLTSHIINFLFGYHTHSWEKMIVNNDKELLWVADHCLAIPAMVVFVFSMLLFKGKAKDKAWFIPAGLIFIFFLNLFRLVSLAFLRMNLTPMKYQFYHRYFFVGFTYACILAMVMWWMDRTIKTDTST